MESDIPVKPNFFIVGTPKSGTTSLFRYLEEHPEIFVPHLKEPHFFSFPEVSDTYYNTKIISTARQYQELFANATSYKAVGDLSSSYLFNHKAASRIKKFSPNAKIIIVLRNPVERAVSHYLMDRNLGYIKTPLMEVLSNKEQYPKFFEQYYGVGEYKKQLERYTGLFEKQQVLILMSDELFGDPSAVLTRIFNFLEVDDTFQPDFSKKYNEYKEPRFKMVNRFKNSKTLRWVFDRLPGSFQKIASKTAFDESREKPSLMAEKDLLQNWYSDEIRELEKILGRDLSSWKQTSKTGG